MADEQRRETPHEWLAHPGLARVVRGVAMLAPLTLAVMVSGVLARWLSPATTTSGVVGRWLLLAGVSTVVLLVVDHFARRLLPLAALLRLSLVFPARAPSRYKLARSVATTRQLEAEIEAARQVGIVGSREQAAEKMLQLVAALSVHDRATRGHAERVRIFTDMIADELGLDAEATGRLRWAALLHDIGKIFVDPDILNKPGEPTEQEWEILRTHPLEGARLAAPLADWLGNWTLTIEQHHERWDGGGYPFGLSGRDISLGARIVAVADAFDVMTSARSYKRPMTATAARADLARCAGSQFDARVVRAFLALSLSRVRWAVGPLAWLLNLPMVRLVPLQSVTPASAAMPSGMSSMAAVTSTAVAASGIGVVGLPALSALDFSSDHAATVAAAEAYRDADEFTTSGPTDVAGPRDGHTTEGDDLETMLAAQVRALATMMPDEEATEPADEPDTAPATRTRADTSERARGAKAGAADAPPRPDGAGPGAADAPPRPDGAGPGAADAPPRPDGAGPGAVDAPPSPAPAAAVDTGTRPTPSPADDLGQPTSAPVPDRPEAPTKVEVAPADGLPGPSDTSMPTPGSTPSANDPRSTPPTPAPRN